MNKKLSLIILLLSLNNIGNACGCQYNPRTFCESIGMYDSEVALVKITDYGRIVGDRTTHPFMEVMILDDLREGIEKDTIEVFLHDGFNCGYSGYFPIGDTLLFNMERYEYDIDSIVYELSGCGQHFLYYRNDSVLHQINYGIDNMLYEDFIDYLEECYETPVSASLKGELRSVKTGDLLPRFNFEANSQIVETDSIGNYDYRLGYKYPSEMERVSFRKRTQILEEITSSDLVRITQHIRNVSEFSKSWQYLAADVDNSQTITILDIIYLKRLILGISESLPSGRSALIITEEEYQYWEIGSNPFIRLNFGISEEYYVEAPDNREDIEDFDLRAIKLGDVI